MKRSSMPETAEDFVVWRERLRLVDHALDRVKTAQRQLLTSMGLPHTPVEIYAILAGEQPFRWKPKSENRDRWRAESAMHVLVHTENAQHALQTANEAGLAGAYSALLAGIYAGDSAYAVLMADRAKRGGRHGADTTNNAQELLIQRRNAAILRRAQALMATNPALSLRKIAKTIAADPAVGIAEVTIRTILSKENRQTSWFEAKVDHLEAEVRHQAALEATRQGRTPKKLSQRAVARALTTHQKLAHVTEPTIRKALRRKSGSNAPRRSTR